MLRIKNYQDLIAGLFFVGFAALGLWLSRDYTVGTAMNMSTGYMPRLLCWILAILGVAIMGRSLAISDEKIGHLAWRPLIMVVAAILVFGYAIERLGLVVAAVLLVVFGSYAGRDIRHKEMAMTALVLTAGSALVFVWLLGLPINLWIRD